jgi:hypothetical protein
MRRILFDSSRAGKRLFFATVLTTAFSAPVLGCQSKVQPVSVDAGGGQRKGSPPMCYQSRTESRKTMTAYDIFLHINNTCSYSVDCLVYDDVTENKLHVVYAPYQADSLILAQNVQASRVDVDFECVWKP